MFKGNSYWKAKYIINILSNLKSIHKKIPNGSKPCWSGVTFYLYGSLMMPYRSTSQVFQSRGRWLLWSDRGRALEPGCLRCNWRYDHEAGWGSSRPYTHPCQQKWLHERDQGESALAWACQQCWRYVRVKWTPWNTISTRPPLEIQMFALAVTLCQQ